MAEYNFQTFKQGVTVTEFALLFWAYETLQCMSHRISLVFQANKCVTVTLPDFVFDDKAFGEHLKKH